MIQDLEQEALSAVRRIFPEAMPEGLVERPWRYLEAVRNMEQCSRCGSVVSCPLKPRGYRSEIFHEEWGTRSADVYVVRTCACKFSLAATTQADMERLVSAARVPQQLRRCTFANFQTGNHRSLRRALAMAQSAAEYGLSLVLSGPVGVGKSHLAAAVVNYRLTKGRPGIFVDVQRIMVDLRDSIRREQYAETLSAIQDAECLVLDDLGAEYRTDWGADQVSSIVHHRVHHERQTVITTNLGSLEKLAAYLQGDTGARVASRLMALCEWVEIAADTPDYRGQIARQRKIPAPQAS